MFNLSTREAEPERQVAPLKRLGTHHRVDLCLQDLFRGFMSDLLDLHASLCGGHKNDPPARPIYNGTKVKFVGNISTGFNQNTRNRLTLSVSLVSHQALTQPLLGKLACGFRALDQLDAAGLTPASRVYLSLHHPALTAYLICCGNRCLGGLHRMTR